MLLSSIVYLKKNIIPIFFILFIICLVLFSNSNLIAAKKGIELWSNNVVPALFPFFIATELLSYTDICEKISNIFVKLMRPIFNVPGNGAYAFILGLISGYPVGAKIVSSLRNSNQCTKDEGNRMLAFTNNSGPLFIVGTVGITLFRNSLIGFLLLVTHILASITVGIIIGFISKIKNQPISYNQYTNTTNQNEYCTFSNLGEILGNSIISSIKTILVVGGFVVLFSVIISILNTSNVLTISSYIFEPISKIFKLDFKFIKPIITGLLELTNGVSGVASIPNKSLTVNIVISAFLLGFGGISVLLQVLSIISKTDLSIKIYLYSKILQGIIAATYTYILIVNFGFFNFNL